MKFVEIGRKSRVLTKSDFGCLRGAHTLNVTRGCEFKCTYCYARGYPDTPLGTVHIFSNLAEKLAAELDSPRRRTVIHRVLFNTASDSFQTQPDILDVTFRTMKVLLERGIGFSFLTKGWIPNRFITLFSDYPKLIVARIGLVSLSERYQNLFEPGAASPVERLQNIDRLLDIGINVDVRIDPIIPFCTDDEVSINRLYKALAERHINTVSISYLHLRPAILDQLRRELPSTEFNILRSCFENKPWTVVGASTRSKLIPLPLRRKGYRRFLERSKVFGITSLICACKNPDMNGHQCSNTFSDHASMKSGREKTKQLYLFS
jgi:DNA repair photolyase